MGGPTSRSFLAGQVAQTFALVAPSQTVELVDSGSLQCSRFGVQFDLLQASPSREESFCAGFPSVAPLGRNEFDRCQLG